MDYVYTIQGWLKSINHAGNDTSKDPGKDGVSGGANGAFAPDAFGLQLDYFSGDYTRSNTSIASLTGGSNALYSGQIQTQSWYTKKPQSVISTQGAQINNPVAYTYRYDQKYQLQEATFATPDFTALSLTTSQAFKEYGFQYDLHGNLLSLKRNNAAGTLTDNFTYQYDKANTNQLTQVTGYGKTYSYNAIGQMTSAVSAVTGELSQYLEYNVRGLVTKVYADAAKTQLKVSYFYDEGGSRVKKVNHTTNIATYYVHDAGGNTVAIYDNENVTVQTLKEVSVYGASRLGTYFAKDQNYAYELKNHLGNVLAIISRTKLSDGTADVLSYTDYYAFGSSFRSGGSLNYRYGYQGQFAEKDQETGWHNFELRMYDSRIGRWLSPDPYGQYWSPYVAMGNDPVNQIDPDGGWSDPGISGIVSFASGAGSGGWQVVFTASKTATSTITSAVSGAVNAISNAWNGMSTLDKVQAVSDAAGFIPGLNVVSSVVSAGIDVYNGNYGSAALNLAGVIPGAKVVAAVAGAGVAALAASKIAKTLKSVEPGVDDLVDAIRKRYPNKKIDVRQNRMHSDGRTLEVDIELDNAIIEVKGGNGSGLTRQVADRIDPVLNPQGKVVIGYNHSNKMSKFVREGIDKAGGLSADKSEWNTLLDIIK